MYANSDFSRMMRHPRIAWCLLKLTLLTGGLLPRIKLLSVLLLSPVYGHDLPTFGSRIQIGIAVWLTCGTSIDAVVNTVSAWL